MKFSDGLMIHSGDPVNYHVDKVLCHVPLRQGVLGINMKIMLPWDPSGTLGPKKPLPDHVSIVEPKDEILLTASSQSRRAGSRSHLPCPSQCPQHNGVLAAASGDWMLSCTDI
ncbi:hypothetical protein NN561_010281 [Cricetulus griseus]